MIAFIQKNFVHVYFIFAMAFVTVSVFIQLIKEQKKNVRLQKEIEDLKNDAK